MFQESGYITEVHHINGEGIDARVVYAELQADEHTGESITFTEMIRAMYATVMITASRNLQLSLHCRVDC